MYRKLFYDPDGPHGIMHSYRVCLLIERLTDNIDLHECALLHDIGRKHNRPCRLHGIWSIEKCTDAGIPLTEMQRFVIEYHCISDGVAKETKSPYLDALWLLKDADALDRVRSGDLHFAFLRNKRSKLLVRSARELLKLSEKELNGRIQTELPIIFSKYLAE